MPLLLDLLRRRSCHFGDLPQTCAFTPLRVSYLHPCDLTTPFALSWDDRMRCTPFPESSENLFQRIGTKNTILCTHFPVRCVRTCKPSCQPRSSASHACPVRNCSPVRKQWRRQSYRREISGGWFCRVAANLSRWRQCAGCF